MLMMRPPPPCLIICLAAIWTPKKALLRLIVSTRSYCASVVSRIEVRVFGPRVVHHDVETAEFRHGGVDEPLQVVGAAGVGIDADHLIAEGRNLLLQLVGRLGVGSVVDDDADAGSGEPRRDRLADPAVTAGYDRDLLLQRHRLSLMARRRRSARDNEPRNITRRHAW